MLFRSLNQQGFDEQQIADKLNIELNDQQFLINLNINENSFLVVELTVHDGIDIVKWAKINNIDTNYGQQGFDF